MEIDQLKSSTEDQMEIVMMMQMDKLPEFYGTYNDGDVVDLPPAELGAAAAATMSHFIETPQVGSPPFINLHQQPTSSTTTISFTGSIPVQEPGAGELGFLSGGGARWRGGSSTSAGATSQKKNSSMAAMREMIFRIAAMQRIHIDPESVKPPKRRNVKISKDPQSVAARHRRERISERIRILQRLVPGGTKMDTASMLDEAIHYVKFLKTQVRSLERAAANRPVTGTTGIGFPVPISNACFLPMGNKAYQTTTQNLQQFSKLEMNSIAWHS